MIDLVNINDIPIKHNCTHLSNRGDSQRLWLMGVEIMEFYIFIITQIGNVIVTFKSTPFNFSRAHIVH